MIRLLPPVLVTVTGWGVLAMFSSWFPKLSAVGLMLATGGVPEGEVPTPAKGIGVELVFIVKLREPEYG